MSDLHERASAYGAPVSHDDLELRHLRVLLAVVDAGGYTRAASAMGVSQSTVSENLAALERTVGARLFRRQARRAVPTAAGEVLVSYARQLRALATEAMAKTAAAAAHDRTPLVIGASESIGAYLLPPALAALRAAWPEMRAEVRTGVCADIRAWVERGDVEVGLVIEPARPHDERAAVLLRAPLVLCARADGAAASTFDLSRRPFYLSDAAGPYHQTVRGAFRQAGAPMPALHATGSIEGVKRAVAASPDAVGVLPLFAVAPEVARGELALMKLSPALPTLQIEAVAAGGEQARPRPLVTALLEQLRACETVTPLRRCA